MIIPFIEVGTGTLILGGIAALAGYAIGSQLKSALKILIIIAVVFAVGLITPEMVRQLSETITVLKPLLYEEVLNTTNVTSTTLGFIIGFVIGFFRG